MATLTARQLYAVNRRAGFSVHQAVIMTAIQLAESNGGTDKLGDIALQDSKWGPSVGISQIRSLRAETGTGGVRDILKLRDPLVNAVAAYNVSSGGRDWTPWSVFTTDDPERSYKARLDEAKAAAAAEGANPAGFPTIPGFPSIPNPLDLLPNPLAAALPAVKRIVVESLFVGLGLVLVVAGAGRAVQARQRVESAVAGVQERGKQLVGV